MSEISTAATQSLIKYPKTIVGVFVIIVAVFANFSLDFEIDASAETLLVKDNPLYIESKINNQKFAPAEFILVAYKPDDEQIFSAPSLAVVQTLTQRFAGLDRVSAVNSVVNVPLLSLADNLVADLDVGAYTWESQQYSSETMQEVFNQHPIYTELLVNTELTASAIQIVFDENPELSAINADILSLELVRMGGGLSDEDELKLQDLVLAAALISDELAAVRSAEIKQIYEIVDEYADTGQFYLGGNYVLAEHLITIIKNDLLVFGTAIVLIICAMLFVLFRDIRWVLIPIICCFASVTITTGAFGLLGLKTTVISSNFIALQLILTLALVIHLIVQYQVLAQENSGRSHHDLLQGTIAKKIKPCLFAGITTSVGFASLLFSNIQPVISFGWMMIVAMLTSIVVSLVLFPSILALGNTVLPHRRHAFSAFALKEILAGCRRFPNYIIAISAVLVVISIVGILRLNVENSFIGYFKESTQVRQELTFIDQELGGTTPLDIIFDSGGVNDNPDLIITAEEVQMLQRIQTSMEQSVAVGKTMSVFNFTELAQTINDGVPLTEYELNSLYLLLDKEVRESLFESYLDEETGALRVSVRIKDATEGLDRREFLEAVRSTMAEIGVDDSSYTLTNLFVLYQDILQRLYTSQITTLGLVYVALALVLLLIFRSFKVSLIALIPNVMTTLFILGVMGLLNIPLDLMTITIAAIAMGIAVDDTIHFVHQYLENDSEDVLKNTFNTVGYAILYTSIIITVGFSVLGFSDFIPSMLFGLLTALAMVIAFVTDITLLPVLLEKYVPRPGKARNGE